MQNQIKINDPYEVIEQVKRVNAILTLYQENAQTELSRILPTENLILEATQVVKNRRARKEMDLAMARRSENNSEHASDITRKIQTDIERCDKSLRNISRCQDSYTEIRHDLTTIVKESTEFSNTSRMLSSKLSNLIIKIVETK